MSAIFIYFLPIYTRKHCSRLLGDSCSGSKVEWLLLVQWNLTAQSLFLYLLPAKLFFVNETAVAQQTLKPLTINSGVWRTDNSLHMQCGYCCLVDRVHRNNSELTATEYPTSNPVPSPFLNRGKTAINSLTVTSSSLYFRILLVLYVCMYAYTILKYY